VEPQPTRDHTERLLRRFGTTLVQDGRIVTLTPGRLTAPGELVLPGDLSSAAFFIVAALCVAGSRLTLEGVGLNPTRRGVLDVLRRMGARIDVRSDDDVWEPRGTITVQSSPLRGVILEPAEVPGVIDELPILMVAAACAQGLTRLSGVGELRVKETDRIQSMVTGLQRLGAAIRVVGSETLEIEGGGLAGDATVESAADHRTAMSLAVAALAARAPVTIRGAECVAKSFPGFFDQLKLLAGSPRLGRGSPTVKTVDKAEGLC
jgi:3-phosphoshikimate 1-carboxyvinyltransferase